MKHILTILCFFTFFSCNNSAKNTIDSEYKKELNAYRTTLDDNRKNGYLQLAGLFKLEEDLSSFGKDSSNTFQLNIARLPHTIGTFKKFNKKLIQFVASDSANIVDDKKYRVRKMMLILDENGSSNQLFHDAIKWQIITRANGPYLRVWDAKNPAIDSFKGFQEYATASQFIIDGQFTYYDAPKSEAVKSQLGVNANTNFVGYITFNYKDKSYQLDVGANGFTMVADATTGDSTYGGGRYIYLVLPEQNGPVTLDFNRLYNPPCSFSEYTTCLYPPRQNNLPFKIEAGEKIVLNN